VRWQLAGYGHFFRCSNGVDLAKFSELFRSDRPAAQEVDLISTQGDDSRFDAVRRWAGVNDQGDAPM
jgi:hypothetical protein